MNYTSRFLSIPLFTFLAVFSVFPQATEISEKDLNAIIDRATAATGSLARREKAVTELSDDMIPPTKRTLTFTKTFIPPNKTQTYYSSESPLGKDVWETINIDSNVYKRAQEGTWKLETPEEMRMLPPSPKATQLPAAIDQITKVVHKPNISLDNQLTDFYEIEKMSTKTDKNGTYKIATVSKYWLNKNGTFAKLETANYTSNSIAGYRRTVIYEYDPNIKIEAPIK